ncbi:unnamed protein product [Discosporangium mesarthrocarpum]
MNNAADGGGGCRKGRAKTPRDHSCYEGKGEEAEGRGEEECGREGAPRQGGRGPGREGRAEGKLIAWRGPLGTDPYRSSMGKRGRRQERTGRKGVGLEVAQGWSCLGMDKEERRGGAGSPVLPIRQEL